MTTAIIVAGGSSRRMGFDKLFADLKGRPVLAWSMGAFENCPEVDEIVVAASAEQTARVESLAREIAPTKFSAVVAGGAERHLSVAAGLACVSSAVDLVAVHDGGRPLVRVEDISNVVAHARQTGAAALAHPVVDTLKRANHEQRVCESVDRDRLWAMETPQVFRRDLLLEAYDHLRRSGSAPTDEVSALEAIGRPVALVASTGFNLKITRPADLELAKKLASPLL